MASLSIPRHNSALIYLSQELSFPVRNLSLRRSPRQSGRNSERRRVYRLVKRDQGWFSIQSQTIGCLVGAPTLRRRSKPNTIGFKRTSPSMIRPVSILLLSSVKRRSWFLKKRKCANLRTIFMLSRQHMVRRVSRMWLTSWAINLPIRSQPARLKMRSASKQSRRESVRP